MAKSMPPHLTRAAAPPIPARVVRVAVFKKPNGGFFVEPPVALVGRGEQLRIINTTRQTVTIGTGRGHPLHGLCPPIPPGRSGLFTIPHTATRWRQIPYPLSCGGTPAFANSDPVIIIDNP